MIPTKQSYPTTARIPGLDGIRALAITLVIGGHLWQRNGSIRVLHIFNGADGVGLFFTLSGFLVTALLLREHGKRGRVDIRSFYRRRARRILPPLAAYIAVVAAGMYVTGIPMPFTSAAGSMLCVYNLMHNPTWQLEHTWSLAIEEQFYILWPLLLVLAMRRGRKGAAAMCALLIAAAPVLRIGGYWLHWQWLHQREAFLLPTRMDALLSGCLVACCVGSRRFERAYKRSERFAWSAPVLLFGVSSGLQVHYGMHYTLSVGYTADALLAAWFILWVSRQHSGPVYRLANARPVAQLGVMSYSVYLWQTLGTRFAVGGAHILEGFVFIAAAAAFSFYGVERFRWASIASFRSLAPTNNELPS